MATSNTPEHDFAPAWLKIPSQDQSKSNPKSSGISSGIGTSSNNRERKEDSQSQDYYGPEYSRLHRQHSFDTYYDGNKGRYISSGSKQAQHSLDDDYYAYQCAAYYNGYGYDKYGQQYNSQPSLRSRDSKYQQPNARFGGVNGLYSKSGYYDLYPYDYYAGEAYYGYPGCAGSKRGYHEKDGRNTQSHDAKNFADKDKITTAEKENTSFNEDFPSLNGHSNGDEMKSNKIVNGGVWENRSLIKMTTLSNSSTASSKSDETDMSSKEKVSSKDVFMRPTNSTPGSNIYKSLVPNKGPMHSRRNPRDSVRLNGIFLKDSPNGKSASQNGSPSSLISKEMSRQSPTPPLDILNTRLVTQPRTLADKKSDFLKALRKTDKSGCEKQQKVKPPKELVNGVSTLTVDEPDPTILSSSLDAEKRLLREMGWDETDEDDYVITEDDMKELQNLTQQVVQQRNGMVRPLPKTWSPSHMPVYKATEHDLNETLSSSSDSDDSD